MFCGFAKLPSTFHRREGEQIPTEFFIFLGQIFPLRLLNTVSQVHFTRFHKKKLRGDFELIIQLNFSSPHS